MFYIWMSAHRGLIFSMVCLAIWLAGYYVYFRKDLRKYRLDHRPHKWVADMATKKGSGGRSKDLV